MPNGDEEPRRELHWRRGARAEQRLHAELEAEIERLRRAAKLQSELVAAVAHELRTPLASVVGFTELLLNRDLEPATVERSLRIINQESRRLGRLIDDLFDVQLMVEGSSDLVLEVFDLAEIVAQQVQLFGAESESHSLRVVLPGDPLVVRADRDRITQVVANLMSNAIKYSPEGGIVTITTELRDETIRVSVRDSGIGIPSNQHHQVFARFFTANSPLMEGVSSVGLGLALSREIVHSHGGSFGFESTEGEGSTFWFELAFHGSDDAARDAAPTRSTARA